MTQINLLPWRETRRVFRNRVFYGLLLGCMGITVLWMILVHGVLKLWQHQEEANLAYLDSELIDVNHALKEIEHLDLEKEQLLKRMEVIQMLQHERFAMVNLLDTLAKIMPAKVLLTEFTRNLDHIQLQGVADTNASISELLRNLAQTEGFVNVKLSEVACHKKQMGLHFKIAFEGK